MMKVEVGDDVFREEPIINELEAQNTSMFGKKEALFFKWYHGELSRFEVAYKL